MRAFALTALLLAGCGAAPEGGGNVTENQLARLSALKPPPVEDPLASARLQPIDPGDITHAGLGGQGCDFSRGGTLLFAAAPETAIARIGGVLIHLTRSAPMGPSGGFFENRQFSISVGRSDAAGGPARTLAGWPGRIAVTNRRTGAQLEIEGVWRCAP